MMKREITEETSEFIGNLLRRKPEPGWNTR